MVLLPPGHGAFLASVLLVLLSEARGDCGPPKAFSNARIRQELKQSYPVGTRLTYVCLPGYEFSSGAQPVTVCLETSQWSEISEPCRGKRCPYPNIENGKIVEDSELRLGDRITFACDEGYRTIGRNGAQCVLQNNAVVWNNAPPHCQRIPCHPPPEIANGFHNGPGDYSYGTAVTYRCNSPFSLIGSQTIVCKSDQNFNGMWSGSAPECKVVTCKAAEVPNGVMITSFRPSYTYEDRILFGCNPGFKLKDNRGDSSCGADGRWHPPLPECVLDIRPTGPSGGDEDGTSAGHTEAPELPADEPGSSISVPVAVGAAVAVISLVAIIVAALIYRAHHKRQG